MSTPVDVPSDKRDDSILIDGLVEKDEAALRALIDAYGKFVYGRALQILKEPSMAEQVAQDTLLVLWWHPERFVSSKGSLRSFLINTARYRSIDLVGDQLRSRDKKSLITEFTAWLDGSAHPLMDDDPVVRNAMSRLPGEQREAIVLAYYEGLSYRQVARVLDVSDGTVKTRIRNALATLRISLSRAQEAQPPARTGKRGPSPRAAIYSDRASTQNDAPAGP